MPVREWALGLYTPPPAAVAERYAAAAAGRDGAHAAADHPYRGVGV